MPGVDRRTVGARDLHLHLGVADAAVDHQAAVLLERAVQAQPAGHDVVVERDVRDLAALDAHRGDLLDQRRRAAALGGDARDEDRTGRGVDARELRRVHREQIAERRRGALACDQVRLAQHRNARERFAIDARSRPTFASAKRWR